MARQSLQQVARFNRQSPYSKAVSAFLRYPKNVMLRPLSNMRYLKTLDIKLVRGNYRNPVTGQIRNPKQMYDAFNGIKKKAGNANWRLLERCIGSERIRHPEHRNQERDVVFSRRDLRACVRNDV